MPTHLPFKPGDFKMSLDLDRIDEEDWFETDPSYDTKHQLQEKTKLFAERRSEVFQSTEEANHASSEIFDCVVRYLLSHAPDLYTRGIASGLLPPGGVENWQDYVNLGGEGHPLEVASRLVTEDLLLMFPGDQSSSTYEEFAWRLKAGSLAFPAGWSLIEMIQRGTIGIHERVPGYDTSLGDQVDRLFYSLKPERLVSRLNWSLTRYPDLFRLHGKFEQDKSPEITASNVGSKIWLRVERQTFRKLPSSGAVVFGIRTHMHRLEDVITESDVAEDLSGAIKALPEDLLRYKSMQVFVDPCLEWLSAV